jgi:hypothetical protein
LGQADCLLGVKEFPGDDSWTKRSNEIKRIETACMHHISSFNRTGQVLG